LNKVITSKKKQELRSHRTAAERFKIHAWRWLATFSLVNFSTFIISRILLGTASAYDGEKMRKRST